MTLSNTERSRRFRAHHRGDHEWCDDDCPERRLTHLVPKLTDRGHLADAVDKLAEALDLPPDDTRTGLVAVMRRLAETLDAGDDSRLMWNDLEMGLRSLAVMGPDHRGGFVEEIETRAMKKRYAELFATTERKYVND
jgi:hypothetical protein